MADRRQGLTLLFSACLVLGAPSAAHALEVGYSGSELIVEAAPGERNRLSVTGGPGEGLAVHDFGRVSAGVRVPVSAGEGCTVPSSREARVECEPRQTTRVIVRLGDGNDVAVNSTGVRSTMEGGPGSDVLTGGSAGDVLDGAAAADTSDSSIDFLAGGAGADTLMGRGNFDIIDGEDGDDALFGGMGGDVLDDGDGDDHVDGGPGPDDLTGNAGDGDDVLLGGTGIDLVTYSDFLFTPLDVSMDGVADDGEAGTTEADNVGADIENLTGGGASDTLGGNDLDNRIDAGPGEERDVVRGLGGDDELTGGKDDVACDVAGPCFENNNGDDRLEGGTGDDVLFAGDGADEVRGGDGDDLLYPAHWDWSDDVHEEDAGDDVSGGPGVDDVGYDHETEGVTVTQDGAADDGTPGEGDNVRADVENITGTRFADRIAAGGADNFVIAGEGADAISGGAGDDQLFGDEGNDTIIGGAGGDEVWAGDGTDATSYADRGAPVTVTVGDGTFPEFSPVGDGNDGEAGEGDDVNDVEQVTGGAAGDQLTGDAFASTLRGGPGADTLHGAAGNDTLDGGGGPDVFFGDAGRDTATYAMRDVPVFVTLDAVADDGRVGEGDLVRGGDVENVIGGDADDSLTGSSAANVLIGGPGGDSLFGMGGADRLEARDGVADATLDCGDGSDTLDRDAGTDPAPAGCEAITP